IVAISVTIASQINLTPLTNTGTANPVLGNTSTVNVQTLSNPSPASQPGTGIRIDTFDYRLTSNVVQVRNRLYMAQCINASSNLAAIRWTILDATTNALIQQGTYGGPNFGGDHFYYPSIAANADGDVVLGFSAS